MLDRLTVLFYSRTCLPLCVHEGALERTNCTLQYFILTPHFFGCTLAYYREFSFATPVSYCHKHQWVRLIQLYTADFCQSHSVVVLHSFFVRVSGRLGDWCSNDRRCLYAVNEETNKIYCCFQRLCLEFSSSHWWQETSLLHLPNVGSLGVVGGTILKLSWLG